MWSLFIACNEPSPPAAPPAPAEVAPVPTPAPPPPDPEITAAAFRAWLDEGGVADDGRRWYALDLLEDGFAARLDAEPIDFRSLPNSPTEGRVGWIVEGAARAAAFDVPSWSIRPIRMGEHYADCASDGPWPAFTGPVFENGVARLVADPELSWCDTDELDIVLEPAGALVKVTHCGETFLARPHDSLRRRYQAAADAWVEAEITRLGLQRGSAPTKIAPPGAAAVRRGGAELECVPAHLVGADGDRPRLACLGDPGGQEVWFDTDGRADHTAHLHNHCGWFAIDRRSEPDP